MDFNILGPIEVRDERGELSLGGGKQRALLALLLIHPNESLSTDRLIDELWAEQPPPTAAKILQNYVSQLRRVLGEDRLHLARRATRLQPNHTTRGNTKRHMTAQRNAPTPHRTARDDTSRHVRRLAWSRTRT
jgi:DNA-binding SARP family transcriptional activator